MSLAPAQWLPTRAKATQVRRVSPCDNRVVCRVEALLFFIIFLRLLPWLKRSQHLDHSRLLLLVLLQMPCLVWVPARPAWQARQAPALTGRSHSHRAAKAYHPHLQASLKSSGMLAMNVNDKLRHVDMGAVYTQSKGK